MSVKNNEGKPLLHEEKAQASFGCQINDAKYILKNKRQERLIE